jgi:hypothetical protein
MATARMRSSRCPGQPAHPFGDLAAQGGRGGALGPLDPEPAAMAATRAAAAANGPGVEQERHRGGGPRTAAAQGRGDQLVGHHLGAQQAAVGPGQPVPGDHGGQDRHGRVVEQGLGGAEGEEDRVQQRQGGDVGEHGHPEQADDQQRARRRPAPSAARSSRSTSAPLSSENSSQGSRWATARPATSRGSRVSEAASSGPGDQGDAVAQVGHGIGCPQLGEVGSEAAVRR